MWTRAMALALLLAVGPLATAEPPSASPVEADLLSEADMAKVGVPAGLGRGQNSTEVGGSVVRMLLALTAVAGLAVGLGLLARRLGGARRLLPRPGRHLSVIESVPLGMKRAVTLVRLGDRLLVVGQAEQGLTSLGCFEASLLDVPTVSPAAPGPAPDPAPAPVAAPPPAGEEAVAGFQAKLRELLGRRG